MSSIITIASATICHSRDDLGLDVEIERHLQEGSSLGHRQLRTAPVINYYCHSSRLRPKARVRRSNDRLIAEIGLAAAAGGHS